jgi:hypothetical protein
MNEEIKQHALRIAEILQEQGNPYQRIEIDADGIKKVSTDWSEPAETSQGRSVKTDVSLDESGITTVSHLD